jgi:hypothetical protein
VLTERAGLSKHRIHEGGFSVVYVSHDCNVSEVISDCQSHKKLPLDLRVKAPLIQSVIDCACLEPMKFASQEAYPQV